ncbi:MAG: hypothetical protein L6Q37_11345, partial [Bdellovibrionaceae bacterium]|nr:hypothetical protein [Pseudobdellovibrionaceae bacterium]
MLISFFITILISQFSFAQSSPEGQLCLNCQKSCEAELKVDLSPKAICKITQLAINNLKVELTEAILEEGDLGINEFKDIPLPFFSESSVASPNLAEDIVLSPKTKGDVILANTKLVDIEFEIKSTDNCVSQEDIQITVVVNRLKLTGLAEVKLHGQKNSLIKNLPLVIETVNGDTPSEFKFKANINPNGGIGSFAKIQETSGKASLRPGRISVNIEAGNDFFKHFKNEIMTAFEHIQELQPQCEKDFFKEQLKGVFIRITTALNVPEKCSLEKQSVALLELRKKELSSNDKVIKLLNSDLFFHPIVQKKINSVLDQMAQNNGFLNRGAFLTTKLTAFLANRLSKEKEFLSFLSPVVSEALQPIADATNRGIKRLPKAIEKGLKQIPAVDLNSGDISGAVSFEELLAKLNKSQRMASGVQVSLGHKECPYFSEEKTNPFLSSETDISIDFSLSAIESYFEKLRLKGLLKVCTGSDDLETCKGGKELVVNAKPRLYFQNNKLMMKLPHNVSVGNFETDFELALEKCQKGY